MNTFKGYLREKFNQSFREEIYNFRIENYCYS